MCRKERHLDMMEATGRVRSTRLLGVGVDSGGVEDWGICLAGH